MRKHFPATRERAEEAARLYQEGVLVEEIRMRLHCSMDLLYAGLTLAGIPRRGAGNLSNHKSTVQREKHEHIKELYAAGLTYDAIGQHYGISRQRVHQIVTGYKPPVSKQARVK